MNTRMKVPQMTGVRQSVEIQHGVSGVGKMLRRGLHGAKNWVLELDENGEHRSVWSKAFRTFVVLMPVWIVLSAVTGGPERGGHSVGAFQSVLVSLLLLLVGLAVFSARERRLGNEEPWQGLSKKEVSDTESDDGEAKTLVETSPEEASPVSENAQVTDSGSDENGETAEDDSVNSTETTRIEQADLHEGAHEATFPEPETVAIPAPEAPTAVLPQVMQQATTEGTKEEESGRTFDAIASVVDDFRRNDVQQATPEPPYSLVKDDVEPVREALQQATPEWSDLDVSGVAESDDGSIPDEPTTPLRVAVQTPLHEEAPATEFPQVSLEKGPVQQPLQGVLQVQFAPPGPYPSGPDPVNEGWWIVAPDIEPEAEEEKTAEGSVETGEEAPQAKPVEVSQEVSVQPQETASAAPARRHPLVLAYFASQAPKSDFTNAEKDEARTELIGWLRGEISSGRLNRAEASRMLRVDPSTVTRWLSDDPWAG